MATITHLRKALFGMVVWVVGSLLIGLAAGPVPHEGEIIPVTVVLLAWTLSCFSWITWALRK